MSLKVEKNTIREDVKRDLATLRRLDGKGRLQWIYDYMKWYIVAGVFLLVTLFTFGKILYEGHVPRRLFACVVLNAEEDRSGPWFEEFKEELSSDGKPGLVDINRDQPFDYDNSYYSVQELEVMTAISSYRMNIAVCNEDMYSYLLALNACECLDEFLPPEDFNALMGRGMILTAVSGQQIQEDGSISEVDSEEGYFALDLTGTDFAKVYDHTEEELPLYCVVIRETDHRDEVLALVHRLTEWKSE